MYHAPTSHGPQPTGRLPPSSPSYPPGPSTHAQQLPYAPGGQYYAPPPPHQQQQPHPGSSSAGSYPSQQQHHLPSTHRPQQAQQHSTPAVPHHSLFLKIHSYTPASLGGLGPNAELVVACRLFPQPTAPQTSNVIRLCFGSYPVATRVARNPHPQPPAPPAPSGGPAPQAEQPGQELLLRCEVPSWDELVDRGSVQPGEPAGRVYLFCEVLRPNQVHGQPEHVLQRVWYGEFDYHGATGWEPAADDRAAYLQQPQQHRRPQPQAPYAAPIHVQPSKRAGSPLLSPRRESPQFYHHRSQPPPPGPYGAGYDEQQQQQQQQASGPYIQGGGHHDYGAYPGPTEYDRGFEVQVEGGYYHPDPHSQRHPQQPYPPTHHGYPSSAPPPHLMSSAAGYSPHGTPPSPSSLHTPSSRAAYDPKRPDNPRPYGGHGPQHANRNGLAWGPPPPSANPSVILAPPPPPGGVELEPPYSPGGPPKGPPPPIRTTGSNLAAPPLPGQLVRNLQPKSPKGPPTKKPRPSGGSGSSSGATSAMASLDAAPTTTTSILPGGGLTVTTTMKAKLELHGNLEAMALGWSRPEFENRRRLVQFWRKQVGATIEVAYKPVDQAEWQKDTIVISCIWRLEKNECYVTSVDTIYLLEAIIGNRFTVEEKNRIRRNLEGLKPDTISKNKDDTRDFFEVIMGFPDPKPRHIEKDVKVFRWEKLAEALTKIISKYSVAYNGPPPPMPPVSPAPGPVNANPVPGPLRAPPTGGSSGQIGTIPLPDQAGGSGPPYHDPPPPTGPVAGPSSYGGPPSLDYSQPPMMASYPPHGTSPQAYAPPPPGQHAYQGPVSTEYGSALEPAPSGPPDLGPGDIKVGAGHSVPLSFEFSDYFSTGTPPAAPPPMAGSSNGGGGGSVAPSQPQQQPTPSNLGGPSSGGPTSDYHSPHRPSPLPTTTTPSSATAATGGGGGGGVPSPLAPNASQQQQVVDPSSLRRPASEPPTIMSGVDLQPSPFSTLSFDGGVATATPEPVHLPARLPSSLAAHELAGISLDLGDAFDFAGIDHGRSVAGGGSGVDDGDDGVGGGGGSDAADPHYGGLLDDLQDSHQHLHHHHAM